MARGNVRVSITADASGLDRGVRQAERALGRLGTGSKRSFGAMKAAALGAGASFTGAFIGAAKATIDFDRNMRNVNSIAQLSEDQLKSLSRQVLNLAGDTAQAPGTLAKGLYTLVSSGFDAKESMLILEKSARAATAGLTTTETSTQAVSAVLNAYRLPAKAAGKVSDTLFRTVDKGVISFENLAENIGDSLPFAAQLNVSLAEVGAATATMTKQGLSAPETFTRIRNVMVSLLKPSDALQKAYRQLGVESGEQLIKQKGFQGALDALVGTTDGSKKALAALFPNIRSLGGALALTGKNSKAAAKDLEALQNSSGATSRALAQQSQSLSFAWHQVTAQLTAAAITVGSKLVPPIAEFLQQLRTGKGAGGAFAADMRGLAQTASVLGQTLGPPALAIAKLGLAATHLGAQFLGSEAGAAVLGAALGGLATKLTLLAGVWAVSKITAFIGALKGALLMVRLFSAGLIATPWGAIAVGIGTIIGAVVAFSGTTKRATTTQQQFRDALLGVRNALDTYADSAGVVKDAQLAHKGAVLGLRAAEKNLHDLRKSGTASALEIEQAELAVATAKREVTKAAKEAERAERDRPAKDRQAIADARKNVKTLKDYAHDTAFAAGVAQKYGTSQKQQAAAVKKAADAQLALKRGQLQLATAQGAGYTKTLRLKEQLLFLATAAGRPKKELDKLRAAIERLKSKKLTIAVQYRTYGTPNVSDQGFPRPRGPSNRRGGIIRRRAGGLIPAMLSPGEVGVEPDGRSFTVPGRRVRADTVPMLLRPQTAILTGSGQGMVARGATIGEAIKRQAPHFAAGGMVGPRTAAKSLRQVGITRDPKLTTLVATAGRESRWDKRAKGGPNDDGTYDHGFLQANDIWQKDRVVKRLWPERYTWTGGAKIARRIADVQGPSAWRLPSNWGIDSTISQFVGTAKKAVKWARGRGGTGTGTGTGGSGVTPAKTTSPLLGEMLSPLVDDALVGGIDAGREGTPRWKLLKEVLEGIVPEPDDRATRDSTSSSSSPRGRTVGKVAKRVQAGVKWAKATSRRYPNYEYGGGHGAIGKASGSPPGFDCSGYASGIAHAMGLLNTPMTTVGFDGYGKAGKGRNVTFAIRGTSDRQAHMMTQLGDRFFEAGGSGVGERSGWSGAFTRFRHPVWKRRGGMVGPKRGHKLPKEGQRRLDSVSRRKRVPVEQLQDPRSRHFVGWGLRAGGVVPTRRSARFTSEGFRKGGKTKGARAAPAKKAPKRKGRAPAISRKELPTFAKKVWRLTKQFGGSGFEESMPPVRVSRGYGTGESFYHSPRSGARRRWVELNRYAVESLANPYVEQGGVTDKDGKPLVTGHTTGGYNFALSTLVHEFAHAAQPLGKMQRWEIEGGATAFSKLAVPAVYGSLKIPYRHESVKGGSYPGFVARVRKEKSPRWIRHDQFVGRDTSKPPKRETRRFNPATGAYEVLVKGKWVEERKHRAGGIVGRVPTRFRKGGRVKAKAARSNRWRDGVSRREIPGFARAVWKTIKHRTGTRMPMPKIVVGGLDNPKAWAAYQADDNTVHLGRGILKKFAKRGGKAQGQALVTLLHEFVHGVQKKGLQTGQAEGGAETFAQWMAPRVAKRMGVRFSQHPDRVNRVIRKKGVDWIMHEFAPASGVTPGHRRGGLVGARIPTAGTVPTQDPRPPAGVPPRAAQSPWPTVLRFAAGGVAQPISEEPIGEVAEDDPRFNWVTMGNRQRGVFLKGQKEREIVGPAEFTRLNRQKKIDWKRSKHMKGDKSAANPPPRTPRKPPTLRGLVRQLGGRPGTAGADRLTRQLAKRVKGRSIGSLNRAERQIKKKIRSFYKKKLAGGRRLTGAERIKARRLRGGLSLIQAEQGRPTGRALQHSDDLQDTLSRRESRFANEQIIRGVDPQSSQGMAEQKTEYQKALFSLGAERGRLEKAKRRAKKTKSKADDKQVQDEINEVADQMLGLKASIVSLDNTVAETGVDALTEALQRANELKEEANAVNKEFVEVEKKKLKWAETQGPALAAALAGITNGWIGGNAGLGRSTPSYAGLGGLART